MLNIKDQVKKTRGKLQKALIEYSVPSVVIFITYTLFPSASPNLAFCVPTPLCRWSTVWRKRANFEEEISLICSDILSVVT